MTTDPLARDLLQQIQAIPLIDPHTHIDPLRPASRTLDDILGYHYYTELAHSAGMSKQPLSPDVAPEERCRAILAHASRFNNTAQYSWLLEICRTFLGFEGEAVTEADAGWLWKRAEACMGQPGWEEQVLRLSGLEAVFLTNEFDDPLEGFDIRRYIPCLRTDYLVFKLHLPEVRQRLEKATGAAVSDAPSLRKAVEALFTHFLSRGARACAISLPPGFTPERVEDAALTRAIQTDDVEVTARGAFWMLAERCQDTGLPFDLMIGVNRRVYTDGVYQGQDLFDGRMSLIQYAALFNAFPRVPFCISVLSSGLNQELCSFAWIFPNVITSGHWWYSNVPAFIEPDLRARLQSVPRTKQIGYYSDMYKLELGLPKFNMYRRVLAKVLADDFVRPGALSMSAAVELARDILRNNVRRLFRV
jgi:glucuronate isomerase